MEITDEENDELRRLWVYIVLLYFCRDCGAVIRCVWDGSDLAFSSRRLNFWWDVVLTRSWINNITTWLQANIILCRMQNRLRWLWARNTPFLVCTSLFNHPLCMYICICIFPLQRWQGRDWIYPCSDWLRSHSAGQPCDNCQSFAPTFEFFFAFSEVYFSVALAATEVREGW
jgi:hypothetical protein